MTTEMILGKKEALVRDNWVYETKSKQDFFKALDEYLSDTEIREVETKSIKTVAVIDTDCDDIRTAVKLPEDVSDAAISGTSLADGSNLAVVDTKKCKGMLLSPTASGCLVDRLGCRCPAFTKIPLIKKIEWLNTAAKHMSNKRLYAIIRSEKARGIVSEKYNVISQKEIFDKTISNLMDEFDSVSFKSGFITHDFSSVNIEIDDEEILESYKDWLSSVGFTYLDDAKITINISTSDTTDSAVNLSVMLASKGVNILLGSPVSMPHFKSSSSEAWLKKISGVAGHVEDLVSAVTHLGEIHLKYPEAVLVSLGKQAGMSKKLIAAAANEFVEFTSTYTSDITAHDVFYYLYKVLYGAEMSKESYVRISENISRYLNPNFTWSDYDAPVDMG